MHPLRSNNNAEWSASHCSRAACRRRSRAGIVHCGLEPHHLTLRSAQPQFRCLQQRRPHSMPPCLCSHINRDDVADPPTAGLGDKKAQYSEFLRQHRRFRGAAPPDAASATNVNAPGCRIYLFNSLPRIGYPRRKARLVKLPQRLETRRADGRGGVADCESHHPILAARSRPRRKVRAIRHLPTDFRLQKYPTKMLPVCTLRRTIRI